MLDFFFLRLCQPEFDVDRLGQDPYLDRDVLVTIYSSCETKRSLIAVSMIPVESPLPISKPLPDTDGRLGSCRLKWNHHKLPADV